MATETAIQASSPVTTTVRAKRRLSQLWQVPVLLAGLAAVIGVYAWRPLWTEGSAHRLDRDLSAARRALDQSPPDSERALHLAESALAAADSFPERKGEAHF